MKKTLILVIIFFLTFYLHSNEVKLYPSKIVAESFLMEGKEIYGVEKLYDGNPNTSFAFGINGDAPQVISFYFDDEVELTSFEIVNGFQEKDNLYEQNARVDRVIIYPKDRYGNSNSYIYKISDTKKPQKFDIKLPENKKINKISITFDFPGYMGSKYKDVCLSEITFYGNDSESLKINKTPDKLSNYFKSIKYYYENDYSSFFEKEIDYKYSRGGIVKINNDILDLQYAGYLTPESNMGIRGKFYLNKNELIFTPDEILFVNGKNEKAKLIWKTIENKQVFKFIVSQEKCFIKLIPIKKYNILKPILDYIREWKQFHNNTPKGDYIPIVIQ